MKMVTANRHDMAVTAAQARPPTWSDTHPTKTSQKNCTLFGTPEVTFRRR